MAAQQRAPGAEGAVLNMDETVSRATFDATLDECVEVMLRAAQRSPVLQRTRRKAMLWSGGTAVFFLLAGAHLFWHAAYAIPAALVASLLVGPSIAYLAKQDYDRSGERRIRQHLRDKLRGASTLHCEVELRPEGLWFKSDNVETLHRWLDVTAVEDTPVSVDLSAKNTTFVVRNRAFGSPAERESFLGHARRLASAAAASG